MKPKLKVKEERRLNYEKLVVTKGGKVGVYSRVPIRLSDKDENEWDSIVAILTFIN